MELLLFWMSCSISASDLLEVLLALSAFKQIEALLMNAYALSVSGF